MPNTLSKSLSPLISITLILFLVTTTLYSTTVMAAAAATYNVVSFGARPGGHTDSSKAFLSAWARACASRGPAEIYVPEGHFLLGGSVVFRGKYCKNKGVSIKIDGTLVAPSDYRVIGEAENWLLFDNVDGVSIHGGVLDGQGTSLWDCKSSGHGNCPTGATTLEFRNSKNIIVSGLTSVNSQLFHMLFRGCQNVKTQGVKIMAAGDSPNTDGIHVQMSSHVTITNSKIRTGDDCISIGPGTTNLSIQNIACGPGHGISIGSLGWDLNEAGVQDVTVKTVTFTETQNGVRIKSWGRPTNGFVKNVVFQDLIMVNAQNPIIVDQNYCPNNKGCPRQASGIKISDVRYQNIHGTSATPVAIKFDCSSKHPCSGIKLEEVKLTYNNQVAQASCKHAGGATMGSVQPDSCL